MGIKEFFTKAFGDMKKSASRPLRHELTISENNLS